MWGRRFPKPYKPETLTLHHEVISARRQGRQGLFRSGAACAAADLTPPAVCSREDLGFRAEGAVEVGHFLQWALQRPCIPSCTSLCKPDVIVNARTHFWSFSSRIFASFSFFASENERMIGHPPPPLNPCYFSELKKVKFEHKKLKKERMILASFAPSQ